MKQENKNKVKDTLSDLLGDLPDEIPGLSCENPLPKISRSDSSQTAQMDKAKKKATRVMTSLLKFYLSEEIIEEHEYIKAKASIDEYALSMLIRQMQNSETAISILMDMIHEGDIAPRMFEVLSDMQRTLLDIIKSQTMYMMAIEENAKKLSRDIDVYKGRSENDNSKNKSKGLKARGTKEIMRALQQTIQDEDIEDVDTDTNEK